MEFKLELHPSPRQPGDFHSAAFSPDGKMLAFGYSETIRLWNAVSEKTIATFELHDGPIMSLVFSPDGQRILSTSSDQKFRIWDVASRSSLAVLDSHTDKVLSVAYSPDGNTIASGSRDNTIRTWDATSHTELALMEGHTGGVNSVAFSPDGTMIVSGSSDNSVRIWDKDSGSSIAVLNVHSGEVVSVAYSPDNKSIASGSRDNTICVTTNVESESPVSRSYKAHDDWVCSIRYSPHSKWVVSGGRDRSVRLWDAMSGTLLGKSEVEGGVDFVAFSPNNLRIVSGIDGQSVNVWDVVDPVFEELASGGCSSEDALRHLSNQPATTDRPEPIFIPSKPAALFALIIGINKYKSSTIENLNGAVADAKSVEEWLEDDLNVPRSHMQTLYDTKATRTAIIQEFSNLQNDTRIKIGDPIFIFYAGHGGEKQAPPGWGDPSKKIQMIIPYDFGSKVDGKVVQGIPDRTMGAMLNRLAQAKGDNITVMFDCCHSGSGTHPSKKNKRNPRVVATEGDLPSDLDRDILRNVRSGNPGSSIASGFAYSEMRSHVFLAACASSELAKEENGRGVFTKSVVQVITNVGAHKLTYTNLVHLVPALSGQTPQCEGFHGGRILFNSRAPSKGRVFHGVSQVGKTVAIPGGIANGITAGAEFAVYGDASSPSAPRLGTLVVQQATAFSSAVVMSSNDPNFQIPQSALTLQTKVGVEEDLRIAVSMSPQLIGAFQKIVDEMQNVGPSQRNILLVDRDKAELEIDLEGDQLVFNICDPLVRQYGLKQLPFRLHLKHDDVSYVIAAAAHYHWHLRLKPPQQHLEGMVQLQLSKVRQGFQNSFEPIGTNLNQGGVIDVTARDADTYGIAIVNSSTLTLYPSIFFFDSSNFSIRAIYQPSPSGEDADNGALMPNSCLTVGYGSGNSVPFRYSLEGGLDLGVGFLKLFLATEPVDFSSISQTSPFHQEYPRGVHPKVTSVWETRTFAMVFRRPPPLFPLPEGTYFVKNLAGAWLEILEEYPEDGVLLVNTLRQNRLWALKKGTRGYTFMSVIHGTYLHSAAKYDGTVQTARVHCNPIGTEWEVEKINANYQIIVANDQTLALELLGSQNLNGIPVIAWPNDERLSQQWIFEPVNKPRTSIEAIIFVDDSGSMIDEGWSEIRVALTRIADKLIQEALGGIKIRFMNSTTYNTTVTTKAALLEVFDQVKPRYRSPIGTRLKEILDEIIDNLDNAAGTPAYAEIKPVVIIAFTDGVSTDKPGLVIGAAAKRLDEGNHPSNAVGIQFVQIGNEEGSEVDLRVLCQGHTRSMVDTMRSGSLLTQEGLERVLWGGLYSSLRTG